jgi:ribosome-binding protein aMBF1 (putative translation factor)
MVIWTPEKIKVLRKQLGWSAADLSRRLSCDLDKVQSWELGSFAPTLEEARQLEAISFFIDTNCEVVQLSAQAETIIQENNFEQIHGDDLKSIIKN